MSIRHQLRKELCTKRQQLSQTQQENAAEQLAEHILQSVIFQQSQHIGFYMAVSGEISPHSVLQKAWQLGKACYLPTLHPHQPQHLAFIKYHADEKLQANRFHIPEPVFTPDKMLAVDHLDLVLVPLVAFDQHGNRLGRGAGYYDHTFTFLLAKSRPSKPYLLGLGYEWQGVQDLPSQVWDVPLDGIATENNITKFT